MALITISNIRRRRDASLFLTRKRIWSIEPSDQYTAKPVGSGPRIDLFYLALIDEEDDVFGVCFPDFPGCVSVGDTFEEAMRMGEEALSLHAEYMIEDGEMLPAPMSFETIRKSNDGFWVDDLQNAQFARIPLILEGDPVKRVNISVREGLLRAIDTHAREAGMTRSAYLTKGALSLMGVASR